MNKFGIILGEPNSINSEILAKSIAYKSPCIIIGSYDLLEKQLKKLKLKIKLRKQSVLLSKKPVKSLTVLDVPLKFKNPFKVSSKESSIYLKKCFNIAHRLAISGKIKGFINCPINKKKFFKDKNLGITEFLSLKNKIQTKNVMMIFNEKLSVVPITTHIKLKDVPKKLNKKMIINKINILNNYYFKYFKVKPNIGVLGLNPHNFELRDSSEEKKIIIPCINFLKRKLKIAGPLSTDTVFMKNNIKKYDVIVGMYHDQVLTPFKTLFEFNAANITLGLPYIRLSPDHGIGLDKKGLNISNPESLNKCIKIISKIKVND